jgi:predicted CXXCH cytochrome family protein
VKLEFTGGIFLLHDNFMSLVRGSWVLPLAAIVLYLGAQTTPANTYVDGKLCAGCHAEIARTYARTGMARSFYRPDAMRMPEDLTRGIPFHHKASNTWFDMSRRDGAYYQRRWRIGPDGQELYAQESRIDYVMGSGNHVRSYLHRNERGALIELPLAWYAENGGTWAMSPGHDREYLLAPRAIAYECMFCHNAYPRIPAGHDEAGSEPLYAGALPEGIDCQRCHGPGANHIRTAQAPGAAETPVRAAINNPARLSAERQMEVCMQCHLETTSLPLPHSIQRYGRGPFSYRAGEPLANFLLFFDHAPASKYKDDFEIAHSAYRLRESQCFLRSAGKMTCTTCHNPHDVPRGEQASLHYNRVCASCHATVAAPAHPESGDCVSCHMPKRRTQDVIHAVMTDHLIQRRPPAGNPLAPLTERKEFDANQYRGAVVPYYPSPLPQTGENALYLAVAQIAQKSDLAKGLPKLAAEIARQKPARAEFYIELGQAWLSARQIANAIAAFEDAVKHRPDSPVALLNLADALTEAGQRERAVTVLNHAIQVAPRDALLRYQLGITQTAAGRDPEAIAAFRKAVELDPAMAEAHNLLGSALAGQGDLEGAQQEFTAALRIHPDFADALGNQAHLLAARREFAAAAPVFARSVQLKPNDVEVRVNYAAALAALDRFEEAGAQIDAALKLEPDSAPARNFRGRLLERQGRGIDALKEFLEILRRHPDFALAHLDAARVLAAGGDRAAAAQHLRQAAGSADPNIRRQAAAALQQLER